MTKVQFKDAIISIVVKDSMPFSFFSTSSGFRSLALPIANKLSVSLDKDAVRSMVIDKAREVEANLILAMKNQPVFLKMDAATRQGTSYLAISAQFVQPGVEQSPGRSLSWTVLESTQPKRQCHSFSRR
ncbi:hypothetical protein FJT64_021051 [Amphibalanus amphitrite]|uniref:Uncharacterized protein n=1 Tax=Amphibalanus amphitrite TaxID=1232801 RepID=A0A6A4WLA9_AMPAM|nr:hypothetical protein FJT64_021051 [Amphibalanus amphitrite]